MPYKESLQKKMAERKGRITYPTTELVTAVIAEDHCSAIQRLYSDFMDEVVRHIEKAAATKNPGIVFNIENVSYDYMFFITQFLDKNQLEYEHNEERLTIGWI